MVLQYLIIVLISLIFGTLGFLFSFFGLLDRTSIIIPLEPFRALTVQEIGGHFLFGFIVGVPSKNLKIMLMIGLMALTIDSDHLLNVAGFHVQGRMDHSIAFVIISSIIIGIFTSHLFNKRSRPINLMPTSLLTSTEKVDGKRKNPNMIVSDNTFSLFLFITLSAFLSHIAFDVFVDNLARFPLLAPFSFNQFIIPRIFSIPIEAAAFLLIYIFYNGYHNRFFIKHDLETNNNDSIDSFDSP